MKYCSKCMNPIEETDSTVEEADQQTRDTKDAVLVGSTKPKEDSAG